MSGKLVLIRHTEAVDKTPEIKDLDRQLTAQGFQISSRVGNTLKEKNIVPDLIVTSGALRANTTAQLIAERIGYDPARIIINDEVYEASIRTLLAVVNQLQDDLSVVTIVGHNPSITYLAEYISGAEIGDFSPGAIACFTRLTERWAEVSAKTCDLDFYEIPKQDDSE